MRQAGSGVAVLRLARGWWCGEAWLPRCCHTHRFAASHATRMVPAPGNPTTRLQEFWRRRGWGGQFEAGNGRTR